MPTITFKPGDVVQLKSGGPKMTVLQVEETYVACIWFSFSNGTYMEPKDFPPELLKLSEPDEQTEKQTSAMKDKNSKD